MACAGGAPCTTGTCGGERHASRISSGYQTCVVLQDGTVECWANGSPAPVAGVAGATDIAVGGDFACALVIDGAVECWGGNSSGELGDGGTADSSTPVSVLGVRGAVAISAGDAHACAALSDGTVLCWGANDSGQLGNGVTSSAATPIPTKVGGLTGVSAIGAGTSHTCAAANGSVYCWGSNAFGEIGSGTVTGSSTPVEVPTLTGATAVAAGTYLSCAVVTGGKVACWGSNSIGQLGQGAAPGASSSTPVFVAGPSFGDLTGAASVVADTYFGCAVLSSASDGLVLCWGEAPACGAYGEGSESCDTVAIATFSEENGGQDLENGVEATPASCVLDSLGNVYCMQSNGYASQVAL